MAETLIFNLPEPTEDQLAAYEVLWFQSNNGVIWDADPVDIILVSDLEITEIGQYKWYSTEANPSRYHLLKTRTQLGATSASGIIVAPRPSIADSSVYSNIYGSKIDDGTDVYKIGETVQLMLEIDEQYAALYTEIQVHILDTYNSILSTLTAEKVGSNLFEAEYTIPIGISMTYNPFGLPDVDGDYYHLKDRWVIPNGSSFEFTFKIEKRNKEQAVTKNSFIEIVMSDIMAEDGSIIDGELKFTTELDSFYCSVDDVINISNDHLSKIDLFKIVSRIALFSKYVDLHMKPDVIYYQDRYDNAVRNWIAYTVAENFLTGGAFNVQEETKEIDTFRISRSYSFSSSLMNKINEQQKVFGNIILAGGKDTPFITKTFIKGLYDPNRPNTSRSNLDTSDGYPWVNTSTLNTIITLTDGSQAELRGSRTVASIGRVL